MDENNNMPAGKNPYGTAYKDGELNTWSVLSLIFAFLFAPLGIVFGIIALSQIKANPKMRGKGMAIAGIVIGSILTVIIILIIGLIALIVGSIASVFQPGVEIPTQCEFAEGLRCSQPHADLVAGTVTFTLTNENSTSMSHFIISPDTCRSVSGAKDTLAPGESVQLTLEGCMLSDGSMYIFEPMASFDDGTGPKFIIGSIGGKFAKSTP
jgi:hypothetical protein